MRRNDSDTIPDPVPSREPPRDAGAPPSAVGSEGTPEVPLSTTSAYRSEPEPVDLMLQKVVRATPQVPNSLEPPVAYQASHAPARRHDPQHGDVPVVVRDTTDAPRLSPRLVETVAIPRRRVISPLVAAVLGGIVTVGIVFALMPRARVAPDGATASATQAARPPMTALSGAAATPAATLSNTASAPTPSPVQPSAPAVGSSVSPPSEASAASPLHTPASREPSAAPRASRHAAPSGSSSNDDLDLLQ